MSLRLIQLLGNVESAFTNLSLLTSLESANNDSIRVYKESLRRGNSSIKWVFLSKKTKDEIETNYNNLSQLLRADYGQTIDSLFDKINTPIPNAESCWEKFSSNPDSAWHTLLHAIGSENQKEIFETPEAIAIVKENYSQIALPAELDEEVTEKTRKLVLEAVHNLQKLPASKC